MSSTKVCCRCKQCLPVSDFYGNRARSDGLSQRCHDCDRLSRKDWYWRKKTADPVAFSKRRHHEGIKQKYGVTPGQFEALLKKQGGGCAVCGAVASDSRGGRLHVDHDHKTGTVRGLLCYGCNAAIGYAKDSQERLFALAAYLHNSGNKVTPAVNVGVAQTAVNP